MTNMNSHKENFEGWLIRNIKKNSSIISQDTYNQLVSCLLSQQNGEDINPNYKDAILRRVRSNKFRLFDLSDGNNPTYILCAKQENKQVRDFLRLYCRHVLTKFSLK